MASAREKMKDKKENGCKLCSKHFLSKEDLKEHFWSLSHHKKVEEVSKSSLHNCTVCFASCHSLEDYGKHLQLEKHNAAVVKERKAAQERKDNPQQPPPLPPPPPTKSQPPAKTHPLSHKPVPRLPNPPHAPCWRGNKHKTKQYPGQSWHNNNYGNSTHPVAQPRQGASTNAQYPGVCEKSWDNNGHGCAVPQGAYSWQGASGNAQNEWVNQDFTRDDFSGPSSSWQVSFSNGGQISDHSHIEWEGYSGDWNNHRSGWNWNNWNAYTGNSSRGGRGGKSVHKTPNNSKKTYLKGPGSNDKGKGNPQKKGGPKSAKSKKKLKAMAKQMSSKSSSKKKNKKKNVSCKKWLGSHQSPVENLKISIENFSAKQDVKNLSVIMEENYVKRTVFSESLRHSDSLHESTNASVAPAESSAQTSEKSSLQTNRAEQVNTSSALTSSNKPNVTKLAKLNGDMAKKDSFAQMVKSPRSWRDRHKLAEMMRKHGKAVPKRPVSISNLHLSEMFTDLPEPTGEVHLENLPPQLQVKIADLIEPNQERQSCSKDVANSAAGLQESAKSLLSNDSDLNSVLNFIKTEPGLQDSKDSQLNSDASLSHEICLQSTVRDTSKNSHPGQGFSTPSRRFSLKSGFCDIPDTVQSKPNPDAKLSGNCSPGVSGKPKTFRTHVSCPETAVSVQRFAWNQKDLGDARKTATRMEPAAYQSALASLHLKSTAPAPNLPNSTKSNMTSSSPSLSLAAPVVSSQASPAPAQSTSVPSGSAPSCKQPVSSTSPVSASGLGTDPTTSCTFSGSQPVSCASSVTENVPIVVTTSATNSSVDSPPSALTTLSSQQTVRTVKKKSSAGTSQRKQTSPGSSHCLSEPKAASVRNSGASETLSYVNRVLELSMKEEALRGDIQEVNRKMDMLHRLLLNCQLQFSALDQRRNQLLKEEEALRAERMKILQEAVLESGPSSLSRAIPRKTSETRTEDISAAPQESSNQRQARGQEDHEESGISHADSRDRPASYVQNNRVPGDSSSTPVDAVPSTLSVVPDHLSGNSLTQEPYSGSITASAGTTPMKPLGQTENSSHVQQTNPECRNVSSGLPGVAVKVEPLSETEDVPEQVLSPTPGAVSNNSTLSSTGLPHDPSRLNVAMPLNVSDSELRTGPVLNENPLIRETDKNIGAGKKGKGSHCDPEVGMLPGNNTVLQDSDRRAAESIATYPVRGHLREDKASVESSGNQLGPKFPAVTALLRTVDDASSSSRLPAGKSIGSGSVVKNPRKSRKVSVPKTKKKALRKKGVSKKAQTSDGKILQDKLGLANTLLPDFCMQYMGTLKEGDDKSSIISKLASNLIASQLSSAPCDPQNVPLPELSCASGGTDPAKKPSNLGITNQPDDLQAKNSFFNRLRETFDQSMTGRGVPVDDDVEDLPDIPSSHHPDTGLLDGSTAQQKFDTNLSTQHQSGISVADDAARESCSPELMSPPTNTKTKEKCRTRKKRVQLQRNSTSGDCSSDSTQDEDTIMRSKRTKRPRLADNKTSASVRTSQPDSDVVLSSTDTELVSERDDKRDREEASDANPNDESVNETEKADVDMSDLKCRKFTGPDCNVTGVKVYEDQLYVCYNGYCAKRFDLSQSEGSQCVTEYSTGNVPIMCMAVTKKAHSTKITRVFLAGDGQVLFIFNAKTGDQLHKHNFGDKIRCLHCRWGHLFMGLNNGAVIIYDLKENKTLGAYRCASKAVTCLTSATEGVRKIICVASLDASIGVFDASSGMMLRTLGGHSGVPNALQTRNHRLFSVSGDGRTLVHDICTGALEQILSRSGSYLSAVLAIEVDKELLVLTAGYDKYIRSYSVERQKVEQVYYGSGYGVLTCIDMYRGMLFTGNRDGLVEAVPYDPQVCYPCEAEGCGLVFGMYEHLLHHLRADHQLVSCSWKSCGQLLSTTDEKAIDDHMTRHLLKS